MLGKLLGTARAARTRQRQSTSPPAYPRRVRPRLELLEKRDVPTVNVWLNGPVLTADCDPNSPNTVTVDHSGTFALINGYSWADANYTRIQINGGAGGLATTIRANVKPLTLVGMADYDTVDVGDTNNRVQGIQGALDIENPPWYNIVTIHDKWDNWYNRAATIDVVTIGGNLFERVAIQGSATMDCKVTDTRALKLETGLNGSIVNVRATDTWFNDGVNGITTISQRLSSGNDVVTVGDAGSMARIQGPLTVANSGPYTTLNLDDSTDTANHDNVTIGLSGITGLSPGRITTTSSSVSTLNVVGGSGNDRYTVIATPAYNSMTLTVGSGRQDTLDIWSTTVSSTFNGNAFLTATVGNAGSVQNILGSLRFTNRSDYISLTVDDSADTIGRGVTMDVSGGWGSITGLAPATINYEVAFYDMSDVTVLGGRGTNRFDIVNTMDVFPTTIDSGGGGAIFNVQGTSASGFLILNLAGLDTVNIGAGNGTLDSIQNAVIVNGSGAGNGDMINILDQNNGAANTYYYIYDNYFDLSNRRLVVYSGFDDLSLTPGGGSAWPYDYHNPILFTFTII